MNISMNVVQSTRELISVGYVPRSSVDGERM